MKVFVDGPDPGVLADPVLGFPFSFMDSVELCDDPEEADRIFAPFESSFSAYVNNRGAEIVNSPLFEGWGDKYVFFTIADQPEFAYLSEKGIKLLASPMYSKAINDGMGVVHVPLWLGAPAWEIQQDHLFIEELRGTPKSLDFIFIGDMRTIGGRNREWLARIFQMGFKLEHRDPCLWQPGFGEKMRGFLREIARARYCFAPRGIGSSSARLYEAMLAGTVPIVDNYLDMPLAYKVKCFGGAVQAPEKELFPYHSLPRIGNEYLVKRETAMAYWDSYCYLSNCARSIQETCFG